MESRKLQEYERRKALERERKKNRIAAHRKICSRTVAKNFVDGMLGSAIGYLTDVGYFTDTFKVDVLEQNVLPWLFGRVEGFVEELDVLGDFGDVFVGANVNEYLTTHEQTVKAEYDRKESVRKAIEEAHRQKLEDKRKRKEAKEQARKTAALKALKDDINRRFIQKGEYKESILSHEVSEVTGFYFKTPTIGTLGGFLGQMILVMGGAHRLAKKEGVKNLLQPKIVQSFMFTYIDAKMKTEKFTLQVGKAVEQFLNSLEKPLQLNEMRVMKEQNYQRFRHILSDTTLFGDDVLGLMRSHNKLLGISKKAFDAVYEGFWDLYCKKPGPNSDIQVKKLDGFLTRVKLIVPPADTVDEEGNLI
jgi:hypothetical protein